MKIARLLVAMIVVLGCVGIAQAKHKGSTKKPPLSVDGTILSIASDAHNMVVMPNYTTDDPGLSTVAVVVDSKTKVTINGTSGKKFSDLKVGFKVHCTGGKADSGAVATITAFSIKN